MTQWINTGLQIVTILGAGIVAYFHYRLESRMASFKEEMLDILAQKFVSRERSDLEFQLLTSKLDAFLDRIKMLEQRQSY